MYYFFVKVLLCTAKEVVLFLSGGKGISRSAECDKGYSPLTSPTFLKRKVGQKNLNMCVYLCESAVLHGIYACPNHEKFS